MLQSALAGAAGLLGRRVTFWLDNPGTHDAATDLFTPGARTEVSGHVVRSRGNPKTYEALKLAPHEAPTLAFFPDDAGTRLSLGMKVIFDGETLEVKAREFGEPDTVVVAR